MCDNSKIDYLSDYYFFTEDQNIKENLLLNGKIARLLSTGGGKILCRCGRLFSCEITGRNMGRVVNGSCSNKRCEYYNNFCQTKIWHYWPSNLVPVYQVLSNDQGFRGI